jgi:formylglycine-generating enzyme required for sulfatase activity
VAEDLPKGLKRAGRDVPAADGKEVALFLFRLPDGSDMEMVHVAAGDFIMGSLPTPRVFVSETPRHVHAMPRGYWIGRNDVTWAQCRAFCSATGRAEPKRPAWWEQVPGTKDDHPVVNVSWEDASDYARWAGLALPTESQWEKAARGTDGRKWPWGNEWDPGACNFADASCPLDTIGAPGETLAQVFEARGAVWDREHSDGFPYTSPIGHYSRGVSPCGALDMAGNVWQWCEDWFERTAYARYANGDESAPSSGQYRTDRGGSWQEDAHNCRCSERGALSPELRYDTFGFRVVLGR